MDELARRFCRAARERRGVRYPSGMKRLALEYAAAAERGGRTRRQIAQSLGLCEATLVRWQRPARESGEIRAVRVMAVAPRQGAAEACAVASGPVLVMPSGVRVEGLGLDELARLLLELE
jgi:hypothetical protein